MLMTIGSSSSIHVPTPPLPTTPSVPQAATAPQESAREYWSNVDGHIGRNASWRDKDGNGKIDIEVDFTAAPGRYFSRLGLEGHTPLNAAQQKELRNQLGEISSNTNLAFHEKGTLDNPDGKINFGNYAPRAWTTNDVQSNFPDNTPDPQNPNKPDEPAEAYVRGDAVNLKPNSRNRGGHALSHTLMHALGLVHTNPDPKSREGAYSSDSLGYSVLSRRPETETGHDYHGSYPTRPQIHDAAALIGKYGENSEFKGHDVEHHVDQLGAGDYPVTTTISSRDVHDTIVAKNDTHDQVINMEHGSFSSVKGYKNNVAILRGVHVEDVETGSGTNKIIPNFKVNRITVGNGANTVEYKRPSDSTPRDTDHIVNFKTGIDKLDISSFYPGGRDGLYLSRDNHLDIEKRADGSSYVRFWDFYTPGREPTFLLRADGIKMSDIIKN